MAGLPLYNKGSGFSFRVFSSRARFSKNDTSSATSSKREILTVSKYSQYGYQNSSFSEYNSTVIFLHPNCQVRDRMDPFEQSLSGPDFNFPKKCLNRPDTESLHYRFDTDNLSIQMRIFSDVIFYIYGPWDIYGFTFRVSKWTRSGWKDRFTLLFNSHYF